MPQATINLADFPTLDPATFLRQLIDLQTTTAPRMARAMGYYQNPRCDLSALVPGPSQAALSVRPYRQFQEIGLPARITGFRCAIDGAVTPIGPIDLQRKEVVIENDIAWRLDTLVDFVASTPPVIRSLSQNPARRAATRAIRNQFSATQKIIPINSPPTTNPRCIPARKKTNGPLRMYWYSNRLDLAPRTAVVLPVHS